MGELEALASAIANEPRSRRSTTLLSLLADFTAEEVSASFTLPVGGAGEGDARNGGGAPLGEDGAEGVLIDVSDDPKDVVPPPQQLSGRTVHHTNTLETTNGAVKKPGENGTLSRPCVGCRQKRVRCDYLDPCSRCSRLGVKCEMPPNVKRGRPAGARGSR